MKTIKINFLAFLAIIALVTACSVGDDEPSCTAQAYSAATAVTGPEETTVNVPITFNVTFAKGTTCGAFNRFAESDGYPKTVMAILDYNGCTCSAVTTQLTQPYTFTASTAGTYVLNFVRGNAQEPLQKTITVTQ
ncbi:hypothetical protein GR160_00315 [Flavobacterium sp. Sd200]|uniref:hypothetical protein n=1 Tax=Flavobacterium sp. Sd200 TaxID=2692211 RepID=UPI00136B42F7|nr:hypothetical protein [Flavobacterium sp. Sd200]MXN89658.1 hypothetical protein [Flavobacterium sp. Sd200]